MATLAHISNRFMNAADHDDAIPVRPDNAYRLRPVANEDVYFYVKKIDNARIVRETDPQSVGICWQLIIGACLTVVLFTAVLLPNVYGLLAGYQIQTLKADRQRLQEERAKLDLEVARLLNPSRLEELARQQQFVDPTPEHVVYLNPAPTDRVAMDFSAGRR